MPKSSLRFRLGVLAILLVAAGAGVAAARWAALPWALGAALRAGGATEVSFDVTRASPWRLQVDDLAFKLPAARVAVDRASLERAHWWTPSLGRLKVRTARVDVDLSRMPIEDKRPAAETAGIPAAPPQVPLEEISVDGQVTLRLGDEPVQVLTVVFAGRPIARENWQAKAEVRAPGLEVTVEGDYAFDRQAATFRTTRLRLDLQPWNAWFERWAPLPAGPWELGGSVTGALEGAYRDGEFALGGELHLREARIANAGLGFVADGVEMDAEQVDFVQPQARSVAARVRTFTAGKIVMADVKAGVSSATPERVDVTGLSARALGGMLHVEPFVYRPTDPGIEAVVRAESIRAEEVLALTQDLPARASGPLSGRLPLRYEDGALRLGTGWLGLVAGTSLEVQLQAGGLLTAGASPQNPNYAVLKRIEDGLLKLNVTELRLDVRPPNAPASRTAQLRIVGAPADPQIKAPVTLDLNVNGPIESLLNLGLKTGAGGGTKP